MFDIDGIYNSENVRIQAVTRTEAYRKRGTLQKPKFPQKTVMVWLGLCSEGVSPFVIFEKGTVDYAREIKEVLPVAHKFGDDTFGNDWTFK